MNDRFSDSTVEAYAAGLEPDEPEAACELCAGEVQSGHRHLVEVVVQSVVCVCDSCWAVGADDGRFRKTLARVKWLDGFELPERVRTLLGPGVGLAFFVRSSAKGGVVALTPCTGAATSREVPASAWEELEGRNPDLAELEPDAEALIVDRAGQKPHNLIAPIEACHELEGLVRSRSAGGPGADAEVGPVLDDFFYGLRRRGTCR